MTTEFARALDFLISLNLQNQMAFSTQETFISNKQWCKEFATIRCDIGRRCGKTHYIKSRANFGDLIITNKYNQKKMFMHPIPSAHVISQSELEMTGAIWPRYHRIYIDEPGKLNLDLVYDIFARDARQLFMILGS